MMLNPALPYRLLLGYLLIAVAVLGCSSTTLPSQQSLDAVAKSTLGSNYTTTYNESKQYALCQQKSSNNDHALRSFKFIVVKLADNTITEQGSFKNGYAKWIDDKSIEVSSSGVDEKRSTKILNVSSQES